MKTASVKGEKMNGKKKAVRKKLRTNKIDPLAIIILAMLVACVVMAILAASHYEKVERELWLRRAGIDPALVDPVHYSSPDPSPEEEGE